MNWNKLFGTMVRNDSEYWNELDELESTRLRQNEVRSDGMSWNKMLTSLNNYNDLKQSGMNWNERSDENK